MYVSPRPFSTLLILRQQDYRAEWQNTLLFLASLGGSCLLDGAPAPHQLSKWCPPELLPPELKTVIPSEDLVKRFIGTVVDMLINEDILTRETAKEALGSELHPKLYPLLLAQLDTWVAIIFTRENSVLIVLPQGYLAIIRWFCTCRVG